jgi:hypothetical protein
MRQGKRGRLIPPLLPKTVFVADKTEHPQAVALSNAIAARPFHAIRFCPCGRLADRLGCRRTRPSFRHRPRSEELS